MSDQAPTPDEFAERMRAIAAGDSDPECAHLDADALMLDTLRALGYEVGCDVFREMDRWYA